MVAKPIKSVGRNHSVGPYGENASPCIRNVISGGTTSSVAPASRYRRERNCSRTKVLRVVAKGSDDILTQAVSPQ
jgi:endonuclease YncB( thermonuclease family)